MGSLLIDDFSGGLNLRDSPNQLRSSESSNCSNFMLTERGGLKRRNGCQNVAALPGVTLKKVDIFYSAALNLWLCARETSGAPNTYRLHSRPGDLSGSWTDRGKISDNGSVATVRTAFVDFPGTTPQVVFVTSSGDATDGGIYTFDGAFTLTKRQGIFGSCIAMWQNKVWVAGFADANQSRVYRSAVGDPTTWTDFTDLREKDAGLVTAFGLAGGALIAYKKRSTYRINDVATGAFTMIDGSAGAVNPRAVVAQHGRSYSWGADGIYECDGIGRLKNVGDKVRPLYIDSGTDPATICAGVFEDTVLFSGTSTILTNTIYQLYPQTGAVVGHFLAAGTQNEITSFASKDLTLYAVIADGDDLFSMFTGTSTEMGKDDASGYTATWTTPWLLPNSGMLSRLQRVRVQGLAGANATVSLLEFKNWDFASPASFDISSALRAASAVQTAADVQSLGHAASFAFEIDVGASGSGTELSIRAIQLIDTPLQYPNPGYPRLPGGSTRSAPLPRGGGGPPPLPLPPPAP